MQGQVIPPVLGFGIVGSADERLTTKGQEHLLVWCLSADERRNIFEFRAMWNMFVVRMIAVGH